MVKIRWNTPTTISATAATADAAAAATASATTVISTGYHHRQAAHVLVLICTHVDPFVSARTVSGPKKYFLLCNTSSRISR